MTLLNILLESAPGAMNGMNIIMIVALIAIFYFFIIRPQSKKQKEIRKFRDSLKKGDRVVTAGGIYGKIREIEEEKNTIILEIAENVKIRIDKGSIYQSVQDASESQANNGNAAAK